MSGPASCPRATGSGRPAANEPRTADEHDPYVVHGSRVPFGSARPRRAEIATAFELVSVYGGHHRLARDAHHDDHEPAPRVGEVVAILIVDDIAARLPECLARLDDLQEAPRPGASSPRLIRE